MTIQPITNDRNNPPTCPACDGPTALRRGSHGEFWGCKRYPTCKGAVDFGGDFDEAVRWSIKIGRRIIPYNPTAPIPTYADIKPDKPLTPAAKRFEEEIAKSRQNQQTPIVQRLGNGWDEELAKEEEITFVIQVNGKLRDRITVPASIEEKEAVELAMTRERVKPHLKDKKINNVIYVPGRLVNIVVG